MMGWRHSMTVELCLSWLRWLSWLMNEAAYLISKSSPMEKNGDKTLISSSDLARFSPMTISWIHYLEIWTQKIIKRSIKGYSVSQLGLHETALYYLTSQTNQVLTIWYFLGVQRRVRLWMQYERRWQNVRCDFKILHLSGTNTYEMWSRYRTMAKK